MLVAALRGVVSRAEARARRLWRRALKGAGAGVLQDAARPAPSAGLSPRTTGGQRFAWAWLRTARGPGELRLTIGDVLLRAEAVHHGAVTWAAEARYESLAMLTDVVARLAAEPARPCTRLVVTLAPPVVQLRTLRDLPPVAPAALARLVAHQPGRFFRKNGVPLVTDAVWTGTGAERVARAAAVAEPVLDALATGARAAGLTLDDVAVADGGAPLSLLPPAERAARHAGARRRVRRLAAAAVGAWAVAGALYVARLAQEDRRARAELAALAGPVAAVLEARRELRVGASAVAAVREAEAARGRATRLLAALTAALPDSAVLTSLALEDERLVLTGAARRAADVVARLERAGLGAVRLEGPVVREAVAGREWERFALVIGATR
jgi:hypothetical protein